VPPAHLAPASQTAPHPVLPRITTRDWLILATILLGALVLRVIGLDSQLWFDEIDTLQSHLLLPWGRMMEVYSMNHHYLYSFEAKALMVPFGEAPWVLRLPALAFGMASIAAIWWLAREVAGTTIAHVTAALLAVSFHHIWFSQNARGYTELGFFATIGLGLFLRATILPTTRGAILFGLALALCVFTHLTGAFFFLALGLVWLGLLVARRFSPGLMRWGLIAFVLGGVLTLILYAPLIVTLMHTVSSVGAQTRDSAVPQFGSPIWTITEGVHGVFGGLGPVQLLAAALGLALMVLGAVRGPSPVPLLGITVLLHIAVTLLVLWLIGMRIWPRFFLLDIAFVLLLLAVGTREASMMIAQRVAPRLAPVLFGLAIAAMLAVSFTLALRNYTGPKQDLTGAIAAANALRLPGERIYAVSYAADVYDGFYHQRWGKIWNSDDYAAALAQRGPVLLVVSFPLRSFAEQPELKRDCDAGTLRELRRLHGTLADGDTLILRRE
jgi:mannosyltransferase